MPRYRTAARPTLTTHDRLDAPGTPGGSCVAECTHRYCAMTRATADAICTRCRHPVGYGRGFDRTGSAVTHDACAGERPVTMYRTQRRYRKRVMDVVVEVDPDDGLDDE